MMLSWCFELTASSYHVFRPLIQGTTSARYLFNTPFHATMSQFGSVWKCKSDNKEQILNLAADTLVLRRRFLQKMVQEGLLEPTESKDSYRVSSQQLLPLFRAAMNDNSLLGIRHLSCYNSTVPSCMTHQMCC